jgi:hypothetical protein
MCPQVHPRPNSAWGQQEVLARVAEQGQGPAPVQGKGQKVQGPEQDWARKAMALESREAGRPRQTAHPLLHCRNPQGWRVVQRPPMKPSMP